MDDAAGADGVRVAVHPGSGRLARRGRSLLFVPVSVDEEQRQDVDDLFARFHRSGSIVAAHTDLPRCVVDWSDATGRVEVDASFDLWLRGAEGDQQIVTLRSWVGQPGEIRAKPRTLVSHSSIDPSATTTDLRDGDIYADGFGLVFAAAPSSISLTSPGSNRDAAAVTAEPPQFVELTDLDVTLAPIGPVTYPDDDTDRTIKRPGDIRCPRGHANASTNRTCRVCGDALDSTANRPGPRASTAVAGLRLPDGSVIPINRPIAVGRSPSAQGARLDGSPRLVAIDAPGTVSRTHVLLQIDSGRVTVTDCEARGRTAVVPANDPTPVALTPWQPRTLEIGDTIQLGGPTTLTITDPAELRVPASLEPTAPPPEREETT